MQMRIGTNAVVAAKTSILLAFVNMDSTDEKTVVNTMIAASRATGLCRKYSRKMDVLGSNDERRVLMTLTAALIEEYW